MKRKQGVRDGGADAGPKMDISSMVDVLNCFAAEGVSQVALVEPVLP